MANEGSSASSSSASSSSYNSKSESNAANANNNLKVPPIKIVLGSNQSNNAVVNMSKSLIPSSSSPSSSSATTSILNTTTSSEEDQFGSSNTKDDCDLSMSIKSDTKLQELTSIRNSSNRSTNNNIHNNNSNDNNNPSRVNGYEHHRQNHKTSSDTSINNRQSKFTKHNDNNSTKNSSQTTIKSESSDSAQSPVLVVRMSSSDRSSSSTPSSESDSIASNSTIISETSQQQIINPNQNNNREHSREHQTSYPTGRSARSSNSSRGDNSHSNSICSPAVTSAPNNSNTNSTDSNYINRQDQHKGPRHGRWSSNTGSSRKSQHNSHHNQSFDSTDPGNYEITNTPNHSKDASSSANQRITRSSQRAAQQVRFDDNQLEPNNCDEPQRSIETNGEKDSGRKAKRRKVDVNQDVDLSNNQQGPPPAPLMANICPLDYQPPSQNSFQLYREIRELPLKKLSQLDHIQPKVPQGFKEYLINSGIYLLDGNKLGYGITGLPLTTSVQRRVNMTDNTPGSKSIPLNDETLDKYRTTDIKFKRLNLGSRNRFNNNSTSKYDTTSHTVTLTSTNQLQATYRIPQIMKPPPGLEMGSQLYKLFQEHEKNRQHMRVQHLKEREKLILSAEQDILRTYNKAAMAEKRQKRHLSACTYLYYQERYHYTDKSENGTIGDKIQGEDSATAQTNSQSDSKPPEDMKTNNDTPQDDKLVNGCNKTKTSANHNVTSENEPKGDNAMSTNLDGSKCDIGQASKDKNPTSVEPSPEEVNGSGENQAPVPKIDDSKSNLPNESQKTADPSHKTAELQTPIDQNLEKDTKTLNGAEYTAQPLSKCTDDSNQPNENNMESSINEKMIDDPSAEEKDQKDLNKDIFLNELQEIDEKWEKIRNEMLVRHKNEAESLYAVQSMEWEWKAKELGLCDVREPFKIERDLVPIVEILEHDY